MTPSVPIARRPGVTRLALLLLAVVGVAVAIVLAAFVMGGPEKAAPASASASVAGGPQYVADSVGTELTFTVTNTAAKTTIGVVEIGRPASGWTIIDCPLAPADWSSQPSASTCRYRSSHSGGNIRPHESSSAFRVRATTSAGSTNRVGVWSVAVGGSAAGSRAAALIRAGAPAGDLTTTAYGLEILDAVVSAGPVAPGTACPTTNRSAVARSTQVIVMCGKNRMAASATPLASQAVSGGNFIGEHGVFTSGPIGGNSTSSRVLGSWAGVHITAADGAGKSIVARIGSAPDQTSPATTLEGYQSLVAVPAPAPHKAAAGATGGTSADNSGNVPTGPPGPFAGDAAPTGIALSAHSVAENQPSGTQVGTLSTTDSDTGETFTDTLVSGPGSTDNASFATGGEQLSTAAMFDFETKGSYAIRVRSTDSGGLFVEKQFTITVTDTNDLPTAGNDSGVGFATDEDTAIVTGNVLANDADPDAGDVLSVVAMDTAGTLGTVSNNGDGTLRYDPNGQFDRLPPGATGTDTFRYTVGDGHGGLDTATVSITVSSSNDPPVANPDGGAGFGTDENTVITTGSVLANDTDPDVGDTLSVVAMDTTATAGLVTNNSDGTFGYDPNGQFEALPAGATASDTFTYTVSDSAGATDSTTVTITITGVNDAPTGINLFPNSLAENGGPNAIVGPLTTVDPDSGDSYVYTLVAGPGSTDNAAFNVSGSQLLATASLDYETRSSYSVRVRSTELSGLFIERSFTITVLDVNEAPTAITLSPTAIAENSGLDAVVGGLVTTDVDAGDTFTYSLAAGAGSTNNSRFNISGTVLRENAPFNFEAGSSYSVRIRSTDSGSLSVEQQFTVTVTNVNEAPTAIALSSSAIDENSAPDAVVGALSSTDVDSGDTFTYSLVPGAGSTDNSLFNISSAQLRETATLDFEAGAAYSVRVRSTDAGGLTTETPFTITVNDVNDAPTAVADAYLGAIGNTIAVRGTTASGPQVALGGNVLTANDTDPDTTFPHTVSAVAETVASTGGGTATINSDGSFTFLPGVGDKNQTDTFPYRITDGTATTTGTASVGIADALVWYVNNSLPAPAEPDGRSQSPLVDLTAINGAGGAGDADGANDYIAVYQGAGDYTTGLVLESGQQLVGQPEGLVVDNGFGPVTLIAPSGSKPNIFNSAGNGLTLASNVVVRAVDVNGSSGSGISGANITAATFGSTVMVGNSAGTEFDLTGGTGNLSFPGVVLNGFAGRAVSVQNRTGGTVTFSGQIVDTLGTGSGVWLNNNPGATINFTSSLLISTGVSPAFTATGGGTVSVSGPANSTLTTTTGTALTVSNTTIGAAGLSFRSITSTGAANGIVLNNTGGSGGLTVSGDNAQTQNSTGGTISGSTGDGISLTNTVGVSLTSMDVTGNLGNGIYGNGVQGLTLRGLRIQHNTNATGEYGLSMVNLAGSNVVTGTDVSGSTEDNVRIVNVSGTLTGLTFSNCTVRNNSAASGGYGIYILGGNTAIMNAVTVSGCTFQGNRSSALLGGMSGPAQLSITVANNVFVAGTGGNPQGNTAVTLLTQSSGQLVYDIRDNEVGTDGVTSQPLSSTAVSISAANTSTATGSVTGNTVVAGFGYGLSLSQTQDAQFRANVDSNIVTGSNFADAIRVTTSGALTSAARLDIALTNNNVTAAPFAGTGIRVQGAGVSTVCARISGNTTGGGSGGYYGVNAIQTNTATFDVEGLAAGSQDAATTQAALIGQNPAANTVSSTAATNFVGVAPGSCSIP